MPLFRWMLASCFFILYSSCSYDKIEVTPNPCNETYTYSDQIQEIINRNCSYSGCHDGTGGAPGNYTTYEGISGRLTNGQFADRVIQQRDMPPDYASGPTMLTAQELAALSCWMEQGFLE